MGVLTMVSDKLESAERARPPRRRLVARMRSASVNGENTVQGYLGSLHGSYQSRTRPYTKESEDDGRCGWQRDRKHSSVVGLGQLFGHWHPDKGERSSKFASLLQAFVKQSMAFGLCAMAQLEDSEMPRSLE